MTGDKTIVALDQALTVTLLTVYPLRCQTGTSGNSIWRLFTPLSLVEEASKAFSVCICVCGFVSESVFLARKWTWKEIEREKMIVMEALLLWGLPFRLISHSGNELANQAESENNWSESDWRRAASLAVKHGSMMNGRTWLHSVLLFISSSFVRECCYRFHRNSLQHLVSSSRRIIEHTMVLPNRNLIRAWDRFSPLLQPDLNDASYVYLIKILCPAFNSHFVNKISQIMMMMMMMIVTISTKYRLFVCLQSDYYFGPKNEKLCSKSKVRAFILPSTYLPSSYCTKKSCFRKKLIGWMNHCFGRRKWMI